MNQDTFRVVVPAELEKSKEGMWRIRGLASTPNRDRQAEIILPAGMDLTPIDEKRGILNVDHLPGPENTIGVIDGYTKTPQGLYIQGTLFKNHVKAQAFQQIMSSMEGNDRPLVGLSVEGKVLERDEHDPTIIKRCRIGAVALTLQPVNPETYVDLTKSLNSAQNIEFDCQETTAVGDKQEPTFTASQVFAIIEKTLGIGAGPTLAPVDRKDGAALTQETMNDRKKKKLKSMPVEVYKSNMLTILDNLQKLYPDNTRSELWSAVEGRLAEKFPETASE